MIYRMVDGKWDGKEPPAKVKDWSAPLTDQYCAVEASYDFVDLHTTGSPVRIHGKRQWRNHLKETGHTDDVGDWKGAPDRRAKFLRSKQAEIRQKVSEAIDKAVGEVSRRPYACFGGLDRNQLRADFNRERTRQDNMRRQSHG